MAGEIRYVARPTATEMANAIKKAKENRKNTCKKSAEIFGKGGVSRPNDEKYYQKISK